MVFSRLLLSTDVKAYISGEKKEDKLHGQARSGEIILCFQIDDDDRTLSPMLDLKENDSRCDGLIFYGKNGDEKKVICLVEMKSTNIDGVAAQIQKTKLHIEQMLRNECGQHCHKLLSRITWKAGFYSHGSSDLKKRQMIIAHLKSAGFNDVADFDEAKNDISDFLRGERITKKLAKKQKNKK